MKNISKGAKIGIYIEIIAFNIMILLVLFKQIVPDTIMWVFIVGLVVTLISILIALSKQHEDRV